MVIEYIGMALIVLGGAGVIFIMTIANRHRAGGQSGSSNRIWIPFLWCLGSLVLGLFLLFGL